MTNIICKILFLNGFIRFYLNVPQRNEVKIWTFAKLARHWDKIDHFPAHSDRVSSPFSLTVLYLYSGAISRNSHVHKKKPAKSETQSDRLVLSSVLSKKNLSVHHFYSWILWVWTRNGFVKACRLLLLNYYGAEWAWTNDLMMKKKLKVLQRQNHMATSQNIYLF